MLLLTTLNKLKKYIFSFFIVLPFLTSCGEGSNSVNRTGALTPVSINISPNTTTLLSNGQSTRFIAIANYTDQSSSDITNQVIWTSSNTSTATIGLSSGIATGISIGESHISASAFGINSSPIKLIVTAAVIKGITITSSSTSAPQGSPITFNATAAFSDNTSGNVSGSVEWKSSSSNIATTNTTGTITTLKQGVSTITATSNGITSNSIDITVSPAEIVSISVNPSSASVSIAQTTNFISSATYTDGSIGTISNNISWLSDNQNIASINSATGVTTGITQGNTSIYAKFNNLISKPAQVTVTAAALITINITPSATSIPKGLPVTYTAIGTYSDVSTGNITGSVAWSSSNSAIATIKNGIASTLAQGNTIVSAVSSGITANTTLTVADPVLASLSVTPQSANIEVVYGSQQFSATGQLTDGTIATLGTINWISSDTNIASIKASGLASASNKGSCSITASFGNIVSGPALISTYISPLK